MAHLDPEQLRALVDQAPVMLWSAGPDGRWDSVNGTWLAFTGRALADELGDGWQSCIHPDDRSHCLRAYANAVGRREPLELEFRLRRHDGVYRRVLVRVAPRMDARGGLAGFAGSCTDIEELRGQEATPGDAEFFEMSLDHLCVAGFDGYWKRLNPSWSRTLGWTTEELLSRPTIEFAHPEDREAILAARGRLKDGEPLRGMTNRYRCKDGTYRWFEWKSVSRVERGLVYAVARDVTAEREAQQVQEKLQRQLMLAERLASVGTLAAGVAHEINNPLAYITANLQLLIEGMRGDPMGSPAARPEAAWLGMAEDARLGAEQIRKIVSGLMTFSRGADQERRAVIDVRQVLALAIKMTSNEVRHRARLVTELGEIPPVKADESRLGQVFINLLMNAAQALTDGDSHANEIRVVTSTDADGWARIDVLDTGPGIPPDVLGRIFDPFFTTKPVGVGTGLGLSISHSIVESLGGRLAAANREGRGAIFSVTLPPAAAVAPAPRAAAARPAVTGKRAAVLVVDDDRHVGNALRRVLDAHNVTVLTSGREAVELVASGANFDLIISDLMMPEMSGMELFEQLRDQQPRAAERMVFITGGAFTPAARAFLERVPNPRLNKPFEPDVLRREIAALLERYADRPDPA